MQLYRVPSHLQERLWTHLQERRVATHAAFCGIITPVDISKLFPSEINEHPVWNQTTPFNANPPSFKRPFHLLRIYAAKQYAKLYPRETFVGVTGSVGKTACVQAVTAVLSQKYSTLSTRNNLDPVLNVPSTLLALKPFVKRVVFELGVRMPGEMDFYLSLFKPKMAVVTNVGFAHNEFLGNLDQITNEKGKLIENLPENGLAVLNWDDANSRKLAAKCKGRVVYFGTDPANCLVWAQNIRIEGFKTIFELNVGVERVQVNYQLLGRHQVYSALAAATLGVLEKIPLTRIKIALESLPYFEHRLQPVAGPNASVILDDTENCSPSAVEAAIDTLMQIPARRRIVVLGEMRELGAYSDNLHRQVAQKIYKEKADLVFLGQGQAEIIADELKSLGFWEERVSANLQNGQLVGKLLKTLEKGDVCLIKGSRATRLDEVVKRIAKKT